MSIERRRLIRVISFIIVTVLACILLKILFNVYLEKIDREVEAHLDKTEIIIKSENDTLSYEKLFVASVKDDIDEFLSEHDVEKVRYEFDGEDFFVELRITQDEDGDSKIFIDKIVSPNHNVSARVNINEVQSIEYRTGNVNEAALLKIHTAYKDEYFAMVDNAYYFLGEDIVTVSYYEDQFYYGSYNSKYEALKTQNSCSEEVQMSISGFNMNDLYYRYGKLNFLSDYYQKLGGGNYSVDSICKSLGVE